MKQSMETSGQRSDDSNLTKNLHKQRMLELFGLFFLFLFQVCVMWSLECATGITERKKTMLEHL